MQKKLCKLAFCIAAATTAIAANAANNSGWYAGVGFGQTTVQDWLSKDDALDALGEFGDELGVIDFAGSVSSSADDQDTGWKIYGGYEINQNFAVEISYMDLGEATAKASASGLFLFPAGVASGTLYTKATGEATAFTADLIGKLPVAQWLELFAKAGVYRSDLELTVKVGAADSSGSDEASDSIDDTTTGVHFGLGANFNVIENVVIRAEWERLSKVELEDSETDIDMLSISAAYRF